RDAPHRAARVQGAGEALLRGAGAMKKLALSLFLLSRIAVAAPSGEHVSRLLAAWRIEEAASEVEALVKERADDADVLFLYGEVADLAKVSTLTLKEIETSGTIALCKFNRLMIVSPRALVRGYPWLDTLAHEFTHFVVSRASHNTVPIWFHEGLAKFEEQR